MIVANPARVIAVVEILRTQVVTLALSRLSNQDRAKKAARLYEFLTSERCRQLFDEVDSLTDDLLELDVKEKAAHDTVWKKRGTLVLSVQRAKQSLVSRVDEIVASSPEELQL